MFFSEYNKDESCSENLEFCRIFSRILLNFEHLLAEETTRKGI